MDEQNIIMHMSMVKEFLDNCNLKDEEKLIVLKNLAAYQENFNNQKNQTALLAAHVQSMVKG